MFKSSFYNLLLYGITTLFPENFSERILLYSFGLECLQLRRICMDSTFFICKLLRNEVDAALLLAELPFRFPQCRTH